MFTHCGRAYIIRLINFYRSPYVKRPVFCEIRNYKPDRRLVSLTPQQGQNSKLCFAHFSNCVLGRVALCDVTKGIRTPHL